jgi:DNA-binding beta-propeller fold protein YncE
MTKKILRWVLVVLASVIGLILLIVLAGPFALSLRPTPKTVRLLQTINLPGGLAPAFGDYLTISGNELYVAYTSRNQLVAINTQTNRVSGTIDGLTGIHGFAADPVSHLGFTSDGGEDKVGIIDLSTNHLLAKIPGGADPDAIILDRKNRLIYVADHAGKTATLVSPVTQKLIATIPLGGAAEFAEADPVSGYVYQNLEDTNETVVVDPTRRAVIARYKTAPGDGPTGLALDTKNHRIFVVCGNNTLIGLNEKDGRVVATVPIGSAVDGVGYDPGLERIYTSNALATMTVIQQATADQYHVLENVPTPFGGHTLAVDPATHRIYVGCPGLGRAQILVYEPVL